MQCYKDKLYDEEVYKFFVEIVGKVTRPMTKTEVKEDAEEFKVRIEELHRRGAEDDEASRAASQALHPRRDGMAEEARPTRTISREVFIK